MGEAKNKAGVSTEETEKLYIIGVSLSEPHTSVTALQTCVCMYVCLLAAKNRKFLNERVHITKIKLGG